MKDLSKRFINIHSGIGPLATVEASKGVLVDQQVRGISSYPHILISSYPHISISSYPHILISSYPHISISSYPHILISSYPHIPGGIQWFFQVDPGQQRCPTTTTAAAAILPSPTSAHLASAHCAARPWWGAQPRWRTLQKLDFYPGLPFT